MNHLNPDFDSFFIVNRQYTRYNNIIIFIENRRKKVGRKRPFMMKRVKLCQSN